MPRTLTIALVAVVSLSACEKKHPRIVVSENLVRTRLEYPRDIRFRNQFVREVPNMPERPLNVCGEVRYKTPSHSGETFERYILAYDLPMPLLESDFKERPPDAGPSWQNMDQLWKEHCS